jgi:16S rRNA (cytidine1402-2'-O)-methyltransferase
MGKDAENLHRGSMSVRAPQEGAALYVVATPIGNLGDITLRALDVIRSCTHLYAEDTRVSQKLLAHHGIARRPRPLHQHSNSAEHERAIAAIRAGESIAYITDAGTPGVSDPGAELARRCHDAGCRVVPVPGPSAAAAAVSVSGLRASSWLFAGFLPARPGARRSALEELAALGHAIVFFEAPHRVAEMLDDLCRTVDPERTLVICRELTKRHEEVARMRVADAPGWIVATAERELGEFVLVLDAPPERAPSAQVDPAELQRVVSTLVAELPAAQSARLAARLTGASRDAAYAAALALRGGAG